jgi:cell division protein FtsN
MGIHGGRLMPQDFAETHLEGEHKRATWLWLMAGLLLGGLVVMLWVLFLGEDERTHHLDMMPRTLIANSTVASEAEITEPATSHVVKRKARSTPPPEARKARFEFYQTLTKPAKHRPRVARHRPKQTKKTAIISHKYLLQVASVRRFADADRLKAELSLLGYEVLMHKVHVNNHDWHRISVGPYFSAQAAQRAKRDLSKNNIKSMLLKTT